jgi:hypothetical protein
MRVDLIQIGDYFAYPTQTIHDGNLKIGRVNFIRHDGIVQVDFVDTNAQLLEPIAITPSILEKNGFVEINDDKKWYKIQLLEKYDFVGLEELEDNYWMFGAVVFPNLINHLSIKYVHELQNELKLLKVEKEIVL